MCVRSLIYHKMLSVSIQKHAFIYQTQGRKYRFITHHYLSESNSSPEDNERHPFPYSYDFPREDKTISSLELACCNFIEANYEYYYRSFTLGAFITLPVPLSVETYIFETQHDFYYGRIAKNQELMCPSTILKAIGIELAKQAYRQYVETKENTNMLSCLTKDIHSCVLLPFLVDKVTDILSVFPNADTFTFQALDDLPVQWTICCKYTHTNEELYMNVFSCLYSSPPFFSYYNNQEDHAVGILLEPEYLLKQDGQYPYRVQLSFHSFEHTFYLSPWLDCPDFRVHEAALDTLNCIDWPQDN